MGADLERIVVERTKGRSFRRSLANFLLPIVNVGCKTVANQRSESVTVTGEENVAAHKASGRPAIWMFGHEDHLDFHAINHVWEIAGKPAFNAITRPNYTGIRWLDPLLNAAMRNTLWIPVHRAQDDNGLTKEQRATRNAEQLEFTRLCYQAGISIALAPEGTTKSDGRIGPIKSGVYWLNHMEQDGKLYVIPCIPVGNTYDFMSGRMDVKGRQKPLISFRIGKPMEYEPVERENENDETYLKRDKDTFAKRVETALLDLNTVTVSQLGCEYVLQRTNDEPRGTITLENFRATIGGRWSKLSEIDGVAVDPRLQGNPGNYNPIDTLYKRLQNDGFLGEDGSIKSMRVLGVPYKRDEDGELIHGALNLAEVDLDKFKDPDEGNLLLYQANRLRQVAENNEKVAEVLRVA